MRGWRCCACTAKASSHCPRRASAPARGNPSRLRPKPTRRRGSSPQHRCRRCARCASSPSPAAPKDGCGTPSSPAITISATTPCPAPRCATSCVRSTASRWPCSASAPRPGRPPRAMNSSAGAPRCASATSRSWSTTPASSSCPGYASAISPRTCSRNSSPASLTTGNAAMPCARSCSRRSVRARVSSERAINGRNWVSGQMASRAP